MRLLSLSAMASLLVIPAAAQTLHPASPFIPPACSVGSSAPSQVITACAADIKSLQQQRSLAKKHKTKCQDENIWDQSTRHPNNPDWVINPDDHRSFTPTAGNPHTPDCASGYSPADSSGTIKFIDDQIALDFRTKADTEFAQKNYAAAYNDYDESYSTVRNEAVFQGRELAHKALKQSQKKHSPTTPKTTLPSP
jgi:hypothetical protein